MRRSRDDSDLSIDQTIANDAAGDRCCRCNDIIVIIIAAISLVIILRLISK